MIVERPAEVESSPEPPITHRCGFGSENTASVLGMRNRRLSWAERQGWLNWLDTFAEAAHLCRAVD